MSAIQGNKLLIAVLVAVSGGLIGVGGTIAYFRTQDTKLAESSTAPTAPTESQASPKIDGFASEHKEQEVRMTPIERILQLGISDQSQFQEFKEYGGLEYQSTWRGFHVSKLATGYDGGKLMLFSLTLSSDFRTDLIASIRNVKLALEDLCGRTWDNPLASYYITRSGKNECTLEQNGNSISISVAIRGAVEKKLERGKPKDDAATPIPEDKTASSANLDAPVTDTSFRTNRDPIPLSPVSETEISEVLSPKYPKISQRLGEQGEVILRIKVASDRRVESVQVFTSSGFPRLDQAAIDGARRWRVPEKLLVDMDVDKWIKLPISFKLPSNDSSK